MKEVKIKKSEYDVLVYPALATAPNATTADLRTQGRILDKLEAQGKEAPVSRFQPAICERCRLEFMHEPSQRPPPMFEMVPLAYSFKFEESEATYLVEKLEASLPNIQGRIARNLLPIIDALQKKELDDLGIAEDAKVQDHEPV